MNLRRACPATYTLDAFASRRRCGLRTCGVIEQDDRKIWWATAISSVDSQTGWVENFSKAPVPIDSIPTNGDISRRVMTTLEALASSGMSIDEAFLDLTGIDRVVLRAFWSAGDLAQVESPDGYDTTVNACACCRWHCCKVSDEAAFCLIQRPYISKTLLTRRISPRGSP
jgi:hypothetical protein